MLALILSSLAVVAALVAYAFWLSRWARESDRSVLSLVKERSDQRSTIDELKRAVDDRDHALKSKEQELAGVAAASVELQRQRAESLELIEKLAAKNPVATSDAIRAQLKRLRDLSKVQDVPAATPTENR